MVCRKQSRLSTIHEQFGHLSFHSIKILARSVIITKKLSNVDTPICPVFAYSKAQRKPMIIKGVNNKKQLIIATDPVLVVIVDQLVGPMPGFIPTLWVVPMTQSYVGATLFVFSSGHRAQITCSL